MSDRLGYERLGPKIRARLGAIIDGRDVPVVRGLAGNRADLGADSSYHRFGSTKQLAWLSSNASIGAHQGP
jgi:hypothetical protein